MKFFLIFLLLFNKIFSEENNSVLNPIGVIKNIEKNLSDFIQKTNNEKELINKKFQESIALIEEKKQELQKKEEKLKERKIKNKNFSRNNRKKSFHKKRKRKGKHFKRSVY